MDFESPDVEKDFPGLYASESGKKSNESDFSDGADHEKPSKKDLLGRRKDKKEKKDRGYAALEGESSPEEDTDTKSPSKSKKTKSFKFPTKSKEKREKSRDKEKVLEEVVKHKETNKKDKEKEKEKEKEKKEKEKKEKEKKEKLKEKDKEKEEKAKFKLESKEKLKEEKKEKVKEEKKEKVKDEKVKIKEKDKDKKDKKLTKVPSTVTSGVPFEEIFTLGVALPIFGVPLQQSVDRSRCHDDARLPLVVRDSIDYLQAHGLKSTHIYRSEADKIKLQQLRKLYTDRGQTFPYHWDVPIACAMLKSYISELPESILTQELHCQFEQATAMSEPQRELAIVALLNKMPVCNYNMLGWLLRHFESVVGNEQINNAGVQTIAAYMCPALNFSTNLLTYLIMKAEKLFPNVELSKYVPPLPSLPAECPESAAELSAELRKQESLLSEIHAEMHAGFISAARDHQLWEAQRIVTQLKRKLRSVQKSVEPTSLPPQQSVEEKPQDEEIPKPAAPSTETTPPTDKSPLPEKSQLPDRNLFPDKTPSDKIPLSDKTQFSDETLFPDKTTFSDKALLQDTTLFPNDTPFSDDTPFSEKTQFPDESLFPDKSPFLDKTTFPDKTPLPDISPFLDKTTFLEKTPLPDKSPFLDKTTFPDKTPLPDKSPFLDKTTFPDKISFPDKTLLPEEKTPINNPDIQDSLFTPATEPMFEAEFEDNFDFKPTETIEVQKQKDPATTTPSHSKPKLTETELKILRLELENAEYLQLKSLLQAKINSEQFEIVKLKSHIALKSKIEGNKKEHDSKESTPEDPELKQRLLKENAMLEQQRLNIINQIFQEREACVQLKIDLAMNEILSKS